MEEVAEAVTEKYPAYKDSGVEWLGEIPEHWELTKVKFQINYQKGKNPKEITLNRTEHIYLSMEYLRGKEQKVQYVKNKKDLIEVNDNDILLLWDGSNAGEFINGKKGILSSTMALIKISNGNNDYCKYFLKVIETQLRESTIGMGIPHVSGNQFSNLLFVIPPLQEQTAIASFIDQKTAKIDQAISQKIKLIELLKERRQILIHHAVTKGIHADVKLKDSGVEWIGEIPEHWEVKRIKSLGKIVNGFAFNSQEFQDEGIRVMKISNIQTMNIDWSDESFINEKYFDKLTQFQINKNDLVFALTRPIISTGIKAAIVETEEKILLNQRNAVLKPYSTIKTKWLYYIILNTMFIKVFDNEIDKTGQQPNISTNSIGNLQIPFTSIDEQIEVISYLDKVNQKIATAISLKEKEIEKLKEYKATLINSAVTGKIKVSHHA